MIFTSRISKMGDRFLMYVPSALKPLAEEMHGIGGVVYFVPYYQLDMEKSLCVLKFTRRSPKNRVEKIRCGNEIFEVKNIKIGRELYLHLEDVLRIRPDPIFDWKEIISVLLSVASGESLGKENNEYVLTCNDMTYASKLANKILLYVLRGSEG